MYQRAEWASQIKETSVIEKLVLGADSIGRLRYHKNLTQFPVLFAKSTQELTQKPMQFRYAIL